MSPRRVLVVEDFKKQQRGPSSVDRWLAIPRLDTPLGRVSVELRQPPDAELLAAANALADFVVANSDAVLVAAHTSYVAFCYDEGWMEDCKVPTGLNVGSIHRYLNDPTISVRHSREGEMSEVIYFQPQWDTEHGLYLAVKDGRIVATEA